MAFVSELRLERGVEKQNSPAQIQNQKTCASAPVGSLHPCPVQTP